MLFKPPFLQSTYLRTQPILSFALFRKQNFTLRPRDFFSSRKEIFESTRQLPLIVKELQVSFINQHTIDKQKFETTSKTNRVGTVANIHQQLDQLTVEIDRIRQLLLSKEAIFNKILRQIDVTVNDIVKEYDQITDKITAIAESDRKHSWEQTEGKITLIRAIREYLQQPLPSNIPGRKYFQDFFVCSSYLQACIKIRDFISLLSTVQTPQLFKPQFIQASKIWDRIQLVKLPNSIKVAQQYKDLQLMLSCLGGVCMIASSHEKLWVEQLNIIIQMMKAPLNFRRQILKNLEMHYRLNLSRIVQQLNLIDYGIFRAAFVATCPKIATNLMLYIPFQENQDQGWDIFTAQVNTVPVRILYHDNLPRKESNQPQIEEIVIHMHGGGYIAMTSNGTQIFTRAWANQTKIPVFSVDYRLAPEHPFPQAVYDCLRVYQFIVKHIHNYFKINPKNIFIAGDSAGGNLACGLTALILKKGLLPPKGLHLVYPNVDSRRVFYGSRKYMLNEPLLWPSVVKLAFDSYFKNEVTDGDPLASPLHLTESYVSGVDNDSRFPLSWPKTYIEVGSRDTLRDESLIFLSRMVDSNIDCKCFILSDLMHGYLNSEAALPTSSGVILHSSLILRELIESTRIAS